MKLRIIAVLASTLFLGGCTQFTKAVDATPYDALWEISAESDVEICAIDFNNSARVKSAILKLEKYFREENINSDFTDKISFEVSASDAEEQLSKACDELIENTKTIKFRIDMKRQGKDFVTEEKRIKGIIQVLNLKAKKEGGGDIYEYFDAIASCKSSTNGVSKRSLTGTEITAQRTKCSATSRSSWENGSPQGWWRVDFDFVGSDWEAYSVEFSKNKWASDGDTSLAGQPLNWEIPADVKFWIKNFSRVGS